MQDDGDGEPHVDDVLRTGWKLKGRVLRPAMVKVTRKTHVGSTARVVREGLLRRARRAAERDREGAVARLQEARQAAPPRREPGQRGGRGALQGGDRRVRRARRRREAQGVRRGAPDGRVRRRSRRSGGSAARRLRRRRPGVPVRRRLRHGGGGGFSDLLGNLFGNRGGAAAPARAAPGRSAATISRPSCTCRSTTPSAASRPRCASAPTRRAPRATAPARRPGTMPETCPECHGSGSIADNQGPFSFSQVCPTCGGRGQVIPTPCPTCRGRGVEVRAREVKVRIPAGVTDGQRIRVKGRGGAGANGGPPGDLYVVVHVQRTRCSGAAATTSRCGCRSRSRKPTLGADVKVPDARRPGDDADPAGNTERQGAARARAGRRRRRHDGTTRARRGDLLVTVDVQVPDRARRARSARRSRRWRAALDDDPRAALFAKQHEPKELRWLTRGRCT